MELRIFRSRAASLLALLAAMLQVSWPLLAQANPGPRTILVQLCAVDGAAHYAEIPIDGDSPGESHRAGRCGHCAMCVTASERMPAAPPAATPTLVLERSTPERIGVDAGAQFVSTAHRPAQPRAPPRFL
jgi:hypothetical protein